MTVRAEFSIAWPIWAGGYPNQESVVALLKDNQSKLRDRIEFRVRSKLGDDAAVQDLQYNPGGYAKIERLSPGLPVPNSVQVFLTISTSQTHIPEALHRDITETLVRTLKEFCDQYVPEASQGANIFEVTASSTYRPAERPPGHIASSPGKGEVMTAIETDVIRFNLKCDIRVDGVIEGARGLARQRNAFWTRARRAPRYITIHKEDGTTGYLVDNPTIDEIEAGIVADLPRSLQAQLSTAFRDRAFSSFLLRAQEVSGSSSSRPSPPPERDSPMYKVSIRVAALGYSSLDLTIELAGILGLARFLELGIEELVALLEQHSPYALGGVIGVLPGAISIAATPVSVATDTPPATSSPEATSKKLDLVARLGVAAQTSFLVPIALAIAICYVAFKVMVDVRDQYAAASIKVIDQQQEILRNQDGRIKEVESMTVKMLEIIRDLSINEHKERSRREADRKGNGTTSPPTTK